MTEEEDNKIVSRLDIIISLLVQVQSRLPKPVDFEKPNIGKQGEFLREFGLEHSEIAKILGSTTASVKQSVSARRKKSS